MPCEYCDDTGWKPIDDPTTGVRRVIRCDCWRERLVGKGLEKALVPARYKHCSLDNLRAYNPSLRRAVAQSRKFVDAFPVVDRGLLFVGHAGVGKTHVAVGILNAVVEKTGVPALFYDTRELLRTIRSTYDPVVRTSEISVLRPVMETPFLVLDDLGAERTTDWVDEMMNLIVNTRYNERRITVFTTNFSDIPNIEDPNTLLFRIGFRMRSRLHEMCSVVEVDAADFRDTDKPANASDEDLVALWKLKQRPKDLPARGFKSAKAELRDGRADLKWPGGRAGS